MVARDAATLVQIVGVDRGGVNLIRGFAVLSAGVNLAETRVTSAPHRQRGRPRAHNTLCAGHCG